MARAKSETFSRAVRRHLRNGFIILTERGIGSLFGAAMLELAKIVDSPVGPFLAQRDILRDGPALVRAQGLGVAIGAVLRQIAADFDPPLGKYRNPINEMMRANAIRYHYTYELTKPDGVVPSRRPVNDMDFALEVPFAFEPEPYPPSPIAVIIHAFYPDVLPGILERLVNIPGAVDLFLSTDSPAKKAEIETHVATWTKGQVEVRILPNRGRDIAAKFIGFRDVYARYDVFLHLHTKRSPHGGTPLARWRDYLLDNLIGSPEIVHCILCLFEDPRLGIVFPQHLFEIRGILNWGYDYDLARALMARMGVTVHKNLVLEFPSGSMFWGRSAAIRPLLESGLDYQDFPEEGGHVDGTLAHAIERCLLMVAESAGYEWLKIVRRNLYPLANTVLPVSERAALASLRLKVFQPCLGAVDSEVLPFEKMIRETRQIHTYPSRNKRPRLNLFVPTVNRQQTFGGIATALKLFSDWADDLDLDFDRRIIVTDAEIEAEAYSAFPDYEPTPFSQSLDDVKRAIVDASERGGGRLDLRRGDIFVATAWWTADFALEIGRDRQRYFGGDLPFVYLIQDDEPYFYGWGSKFSMAEATYRHPAQTIAVINSEELFTTITATYRFRETFYLPYRLNTEIDSMLVPRPRERSILVYGRPAVARNAFELVCVGICRWQQSDPIRASRWKIIFLGEEFETGLIYPIQNASVEGKVSLDLYANFLNRTSVGIALMVSPHPSYPPLEMAEAGLKVITNSFASKDLRHRYPDIVSIDGLTPDALAGEIERAVAEMEPHIGKTTGRRTGTVPEITKPAHADPAAITSLIRALAERSSNDI